MHLDPQAVADVVVLAMKTALAPVLSDVAALKAQMVTLEGLRDRVVTVEAKAAQPIDPLVELRERFAALERRVHDDPLVQAVGTLRERVAVVEVRAQVPGPAGKDGQDGVHGKDGADGLGFEDLATVQQDDRSFTIKAVRGDRVKEIGTARFPGVPIQRGVYVDGKSYENGDVVTWAGSQWACNEDTTTKPGDGSKAWTLIVKRGRDGRDGRDAPGALPVVLIGPGGGLR